MGIEIVTALMAAAVPGLIALSLVVFKGGAAVAKLDRLWSVVPDVQSAVQKIQIELATIVSRVDTIWRLIIEDSIREQRHRGDIILASPIRVSPAYLERISECDKGVEALLKPIAQSYAEKLPSNAVLGIQVLQTVGWQRVITRCEDMPDMAPYILR